MKKTIKEFVEYFDSEIEGDISKVIENLIDIKETYSKRYHKVWIEKYNESIEVWGERYETDTEYTSRLQREDALAKSILEKKRKQLEQLKRELGEV